MSSLIQQEKKIDNYGNIIGYPPMICGPLISPYHGEYNESYMEEITINKINYKIDTYGNVSGYKKCLFCYDSAGYLEEIGILKNNDIIKYTFGYSYSSNG